MKKIGRLKLDVLAERMSQINKDDLYYWLRGYEDGKSDREEGYRSYY